MKKIVLIVFVSFYSILSIAQSRNLVLDSIFTYKYFSLRYMKNSLVSKKVATNDGFDRISYQFIYEKDTAVLGVSSYFYKGKLANIMNDAKEKIFKNHMIVDSVTQEELGEKLLTESGLYKKIISKTRIQVGDPKIDGIKFNCLCDIDNVEMLMMVVITFREKDPQTQIFYLVTNKPDIRQDEHNFEKILEGIRFLN